MKIKLTVEVDFKEAMVNSDAEPFIDFGEGQWETYYSNLLIEKLEEIEADCGVLSYLKDENGKMIYTNNID